MTVIERVANWHAERALTAYRKRRYKEYVRHIKIADQLRAD